MRETLQNILFFIGILILAALITATIVVYSHNNSQTENITNATINIQNNTETMLQENTDDYPNIEYTHWDHMPLTYKIYNCSERQINLTKLAFEKVKEETEDLVYFEETNELEDYSIYCKEQKFNKGSDLTLADAKPETDPYNTTIIIHAEINFYGQGLVCGTGYPALEVHEILHTFDFGHNPLTTSILNPYAAESTKDCKVTQMDKEYSECLKYIYSNAEIGECNIQNRYIEEDDIPECAEGYYDVPGTAFCCPEPNMTVRDGFCYN